MEVLQDMTAMERERMSKIEIHGRCGDFGTLVPLWLFKPRPRKLEKLGGNTPVLTCSAPASITDLLARGQEEACLTFGCYELAASVFIRLRVKDVELYWLVDMSDPEVWEAVDMWKKAGCVPVLFESGCAGPECLTFGVFDMPTNTEPFEYHEWFGNGEEPDAFVWDGMVALAEGGPLQSDEISELPAVPLRASFTVALLTQRWQKYLNERSSSEFQDD
jgi:hypothetical protein